MIRESIFWEQFNDITRLIRILEKLERCPQIDLEKWK